jgi:hypothetical protein
VGRKKIVRRLYLFLVHEYRTWSKRLNVTSCTLNTILRMQDFLILKIAVNKVTARFQ